MRGRAALGVLAVAVLALAPATAQAATSDGAMLSGEVYLDLDGDGTRDSGEPGRAAVQLTLRTDAAILDATVSAADGTWAFRNVTAGPVTLEVEPPNDLAITGSTVPGLDPSSGEATIEVTDDAELGAIGLGSPLSTGVDVAASVILDEGSSTDDRYRWRLQASNLGGDDAGLVTMRAVLSAGHEVIDAAGDGWTCEPSTAIVLCAAAGGLPAGTALPVVTVTTAPTGDIGTVVTVTGTVRLDDSFDEAPLNDEDVAARTIGGELAADDTDGDGDDELATTGAPASGVLVAALLALVAGAAALSTGRR